MPLQYLSSMWKILYGTTIVQYDGNLFTECLFAERLILTDDLTTCDVIEYNRRLNVIQSDLMQRCGDDCNRVIYYYDGSSDESQSISDNMV